MEIGRIAVVLFMTVLGGMLSGYWLASLCIALIGYIAWLFYKLHQLYTWLLGGAKRRNISDSDGIWEAINYQIQLIQARSKKRKKRMATMLSRSRKIIGGLPYATVVLNGNNEIDWANKKSEQLLRISKQRDRGQRIDNLLRIPVISNNINKKKQVDIKIDAPRGANKQLAIQLIPVAPTLKLLIARDISEQVYVQEMRKNFIANASHELSTPLTVIFGYLEIIKASPDLPEPLQKGANAAFDQALRMKQIIEDLLRLSRLENSNALAQSDSTIDMALLLSRLCSEAVEAVAERNYRIETDLDPYLRLRGSESEISSLCSNLLHNAIRHTPPGTNVQVEWRKNLLNEAILMVKDDGPGIPQKHLPHVTERFYQVDQGRSNSKGGSGLGLAIVQHIIQRHDGKFDIQSTYSKGSTFTVSFAEDRVVNLAPV